MWGTTRQKSRMYLKGTCKIKDCGKLLLRDVSREISEGGLWVLLILPLNVLVLTIFLE